MEDVPMSSSINELEEMKESIIEEPVIEIDNKISKNEMLIPESKINYKNVNLLTQNNKINKIKNKEPEIIDIDIDEVTLNEIIDTQDLLSNNFINYLNENVSLDKDPNYSEIIPYYYKKSAKKIGFTNSKIMNILLIFLRAIQLILYLWIFLGIFMPRKYLFIHVISCITLIVSLEYTSNYGLINLFLKFLLRRKVISDLIILDESPYTIKSIIMMFMAMSVIGIIVPEYSIFSLLSYFINFFKI